MTPEQLLELDQWARVVTKDLKADGYDGPYREGYSDAFYDMLDHIRANYLAA